MRLRLFPDNMKEGVHQVFDPVSCHDKSAQIAVILPCFNEELTIGNTIKDVKKSLKNAENVCDNASTDRTAAIASAAGREVICENRKGKAQAVSGWSTRLM